MKNHKIKAFYPVASKNKPAVTYTRHYIHSKASAGLWTEQRDLSQRELMANGSTEKQVVKYFTICYNASVLAHWEDLILVDEEGKTYRIKTKPDEFDYGRRDIRIAAYEFRDNTVYTGVDVYD